MFDHSGIDAIHAVADADRKAGKTLHLRHLGEDCRQLIRNAKELVEVNIQEDPKYRVADDQLD